LGADAYGVWSVIMVTISLLSPLALLGTGLNARIDFQNNPPGTLLAL